MKYFNAAVFVCLSLSAIYSFALPPKSIYRIRFKDIDGNVVNMNSYRGKKLMVVTIPYNETDTAALNQLTRFYQKYRDSINIIGVLSIEDGYRDRDKNAVRSIYQVNRKMDVLLTEAMRTRKGQDSTQSSLMRWLTVKEDNLHFNQDVLGIGQKFFIDESGDLYAVLGPEVSFNHTIIEKLLNRKMRLPQGRSME